MAASVKVLKKHKLAWRLSMDCVLFTSVEESATQEGSDWKTAYRIKLEYMSYKGDRLDEL